MVVPATGVRRDVCPCSLKRWRLPARSLARKTRGTLAAASGFENYITMSRLDEEQVETFSETVLGALLKKCGIA